MTREKLIGEMERPRRRCRRVEHLTQPIIIDHMLTTGIRSEVG